MGIEGLPIGKVYVSPGRTIGEGEFTQIHSLTWNIHPIHTDKEYMKSGEFGERVLLGPCLLAFMIGLEERTDCFPAVHAAGFRPIAMLGIDETHFRNPVLPGDTITVHTQIIEGRPSAKNPKRVVVKRKLAAFNQRGDQVGESTITFLVQAKEE